DRMHVREVLHRERKAHRFPERGQPARPGRRELGHRVIPRRHLRPARIETVVRIDSRGRLGLGLVVSHDPILAAPTGPGQVRSLTGVAMRTDNRPPRADSATGDAAGSGLAQWLRGRTDDELARLMRLRPDLTIAPPASTSVLASRATQRMSVHRAAASLDTMAMAVLAVLVVHDADAGRVPAAEGRSALASRARAAVA